MAKSDPVISYLIEAGLAEHEAQFRGLLDVAGAPKGAAPAARHLAIAATALLMLKSCLPVTTVMRVMSILAKHSDKFLQEESFGVVNGGVVIISDNEAGSAGVYDLESLAEVKPPEFMHMTTLYHVSGPFRQAEKVLRSRA